MTSGSSWGRFMLLWGMLWGMLWGGLVSCISVHTQRREPSSLPPYQETSKRLLYRGLMGGMSSREVFRVVCRRWSFGHCQFRPVSLQSSPALPAMHAFLPELRVYVWQGQEENVCRHYFYFRAWGLLAVRVHCDAASDQSLQALIRRYHRWYATPTDSRTEGKRLRYLWSQENDKLRVSLSIQQRKIQAIHLDYRRRWYEIAKALEPSWYHSSQETLTRWNKVSPELRREMLWVFGHLIDRLKNLSFHAPDEHVYSSPWAGEGSPESCVPQPAERVWTHHLWKRLQFESPVPQQRLQYRILHVYRKVNRRVFPQEKHYRLEVQGCGLSFQVVLRQVNGDWNYEPMQWKR